MKTFLIMSVFVVLLLTIEAVNIKKDYCGNEEYVGNSGGKYPHLHCGKSFLTLSKSSGNHNNIQGRCTKVKEIFEDEESYYGSAKDPSAITAVLKEYYDYDCPTLLQGFLRFSKF